MCWAVDFIQTTRNHVAIEANTLSEADIKAFLECHARYYLYAACSSGWWAVPTLRRIISRNGYMQTPQLCQNIRRNAQKPLIVALLFCQVINTQTIRHTFLNHPRHSQSGSGDCALAVFIALHGGFL
jgi:hypothetical protein